MVAPEIAKCGIVGDRKVGIVNCDWKVNPDLIWAIWVETAGIEDWANITCREANNNCNWEIWLGCKKTPIDSNPHKGVC